jgi:hypothetical protein
VENLVIVVCHEDPAKLSGGGAETLARIRLLQSANYRVCAIDWQWGIKPGFVEGLGYDLLRLPKCSPRQAVASFLRLPSPLATRAMSSGELAGTYEAISRRYGSAAVHAVVMDGLHGFQLSTYLAGRFGRRLIFRSHNIEAEHQRFQILLRGKFNALAVVNWLRFPRYDKMARALAQAIAEISVEDTLWRPRLAAGKRFPVDPIVSPAAPPDAVNYKHDIAFVGSLDTAVNAEGLLRFATEMQARQPQLRLGIYGSASPATKEQWQRLLPRCSLTANFSSFQQILAESPVIVNPVLHSTGVNIKTYESLANGALVVATEAGSRGCLKAKPDGLLRNLDFAGLPAVVAEAVGTGLSGIRERRMRFQCAILGPAESAYLKLFA